jgi:hypothetical protein
MHKIVLGLTNSPTVSFASSWQLHFLHELVRGTAEGQAAGGVEPCTYGKLWSSVLLDAHRDSLAESRARLTADQLRTLHAPVEDAVEDQVQ